MPKKSKKEPVKSKQRKEIVVKAKHLIKESQRLARKCKKKLADEPLEAINTGRTDVEQALKAFRSDATSSDLYEALLEVIKRQDATLEAHVGYARKSLTREYMESIGLAILIALLIRAFLFEAFKIPSGSMIPTLLVGDHIFVNKFVYGIRLPFIGYPLTTWRTPKRGEIIVFEFPGNDPKSKGKDFIKRVVAVAGDRVRLRDNVLYVNGEPVSHEVIKTTSCDDLSEEVQEFCKEEDECSIQQEHVDGFEYVIQYRTQNADCRLNRGSWPEVNDLLFGPNRNPNWPDVVVPEGHVFTMGDNRDNSEDGRFWGFVPLENIKGKALIIWWSRDPSLSWLSLLWFKGIKWDRMFDVIH